MRRRRWAWAAGAACVLVLLVAFHIPLLRSVGRALVVNDPLSPADVLAVTTASGEAGLLETGDLYREGWARAVVIIRRSPTAADRELQRRGVRLPDREAETLALLGVPPSVILPLPSGDGGTLAGTASLVKWLERQPSRRAIVVVNRTHARRFARALRRNWPKGWTPPIVRTSRFGGFRADAWWTDHGSLRDGLTELPKLLLDCVIHPF